MNSINPRLLSEEHNYRMKLKDSAAYILMIPAISIGMLTMISYGVASSIWIQNISFWIITSIFGCIFIANSNKFYLSRNNFAFHVSAAIFIIVLLIIPFLFNGLDGVHRWIVLGPIRFNVAAAFLPLLIISLWNLSLRQNVFIVLTLTIIALIVLLFQPDASQVTALAIANVIIIWRKINIKLVKILYLVFIVVIVTLSWIFMDNLAPVPYVEQILFLVADMGVFWFVLGVLSLVLLLFPFFIFNKNNLSISLGVYFATTILTTFLGNFPMPIMGYGISPIVGYSIAVTLMIKYKKTLRV